VALWNAEDVTASRRAGLGELLEQRQHRQVLRIRQEEAAQPAKTGLDVLRRLRHVEPLRDRETAVAHADGAVPALVGQLEIVDDWREQFADRRQASRSAVDLAATARVRPVEPETLAQDA